MSYRAELWCTAAQTADRLPVLEGYLCVLTDTALAAEPHPLPAGGQDTVPGPSAGQVLPALLAAIHGQTVGCSVLIEAVVAAQLVCHIANADFMANLREKPASVST